MQNAMPTMEAQQYQLNTIRSFTDSKEYAIYANKIMAEVMVYPSSLYQGQLPID